MLLDKDLCIYYSNTLCSGHNQNWIHILVDNQCTDHQNIRVSRNMSQRHYVLCITH